MNISIMQPTLKDALKAVGKAVDNRAFLGILTHVLLEAVNEPAPMLRITATDLELSIRVNVTRGGVKVHEPGEICLPYVTLNDLVRTMPAERLDIEKDTVRVGHRVNLTCGKTHANVAGLPAVEYPVWPGNDADRLLFKADAPGYRAALSRVLVAAGKNDYRVILNTVLHRAHVEGLWLVAADGYRLAKEGVARADDNGSAGDYLIPRRALLAILPMLPDEGEISVHAANGGNAMRVTIDDTEVVALVIDGLFPDYQKVIPERRESVVVLDREGFTNALKRTLVFGRDDNNFVDLDLAIDEGLRVAARSAERGDAEEWLAPLTVQGKGDNSARFNARYLLEAMNDLEGEAVTLALNGPSAPAVMLDEALDDWLYVVMPAESTSR